MNKQIVFRKYNGDYELWEIDEKNDRVIVTNNMKGTRLYLEDINENMKNYPIPGTPVMWTKEE